MASTGHFNFQPIGRHRHCTVSTNAPSLPGLPRNGGGAFSCPNRERTLRAGAVQGGGARRPARLLQAQSGLWKALRLRFFLLTCADADGQLDINAAGLWARLPAKQQRRVQLPRCVIKRATLTTPNGLAVSATERLVRQLKWGGMRTSCV